MSTSVVKLVEKQELLQQSCLGPAEVLATGRRLLDVELPSGERVEAVQEFSTLNQRVRELLTLRTGEAHTIVDETSLQRAKKYAVVAEGTASVNGKQILLG